MADKERLIDTGKLIGYLHEKTFIDGDDRSMVYKAIEEQPTIEASPCNFCQYDGCGNPCIACPATAKEE